MGNASGRRKSAAKLEPGAQKVLGRELRAMYNELVEEPVPDRFVKLLDELERVEEFQDEPSNQTDKTSK